MTNSEDWQLQYSALESLLQCPVCFDLCDGSLYQCHEGHHVCGKCRDRLPACPVCRSFFYGTRNYGLENIIDTIRKLRPSDPKIETTKRNGSLTKPMPKNKYLIPNSCRGLFTCMVTGCGESLPASRLLNHVRNKHEDSVIEGVCDEKQHVFLNWNVKVQKRMNLVIPIQVYKMGLFFFSIYISPEGDLKAWVAMSASESVASNFDYTFTIKGLEMEGVFSDIVPSTRNDKEYLWNNTRCLAMTKRQVNARKLPFILDASCSLLLSPKPPVRLPMPVISLRKSTPLDGPKVTNQTDIRNGNI